MELTFGLHQQQELKLIMTPELRQAITILQYSTIDLLHFLREQAAENPLIELDEPALIRTADFIPEQTRMIHWEELERGSMSDYTISQEDYVNPIDYYANTTVTLQDYLLEQLGYLRITPRQKQLVTYLIGNLNESGYLDIDYDSLPPNMNYTEAEWEEAVSILQQLEPYGVGARTLQECLLIQLHHSPWKDELCERVIRDHLHDLAANRYKKIAQALQTTVEEVIQIANFIKGFNPKPGVLFPSHDERIIIPDVFVEKLENGQFIVQVNDDILPRIEANQQYVRLIKEKGEATPFLEERLQQLHWLVRSLDQRKQTILKVTEAIVEAQIQFFQEEKGVLKPLTLKEIADQIGVHESTVSRATNNKFVQTPKGLFELKYFFAGRLSGDDGDASSMQVKEWLKEFIEKEDKRKPLSDQKLVELFAQRGVKIARRTVAKYRDELGILSSAMRKIHES